MSIWGKGILTRSLPFLPIISPRLMYLDRLVFTLPRTSLRKRWWSRSIFWPTSPSSVARSSQTGVGPHLAAGLAPRGPGPAAKWPPLQTALLLRVPAGEDAGHEGQHVGGAGLVVAVVADQPALDDVDLLLRRLVDHVGHQAGELDGVLLVLEELQLEGLLEALVGLVVELLAV